MTSSDPATTPSILDRSGLVVVDKPAGMTSHDVVFRLRKIMHTKRVGHSGTLDPMATGVLVVGVERGTKFLARVVTHDKRYDATVRLGISTVTDDCEGEVLTRSQPAQLEAVSEDDIREALAHNVGEIMQRPSAVSSIKVDGRRAHELVREGKEVHLPPRPVTIFSLDVHDIRRVSTDDADAPGTWDVDMSVHCSSGTYIRAIARDVGEQLGIGGHLTALRRTSVGPFDVHEALTLEQLEQDPALSLNLDDAMTRCFPVRKVSAEEGHNLSLGKWLSPIRREEVYAAVNPDGQAIALIKEKGSRAASVFVARPDGMR